MSYKTNKITLNGKTLHCYVLVIVYRCADTRKALKALDMDSDGQVDWKEFEVYLKWALHQYPEIKVGSKGVRDEITISQCFFKLNF